MQVKVLELEKKLENERIRLGELRKKHYALAGVYKDPDEGDGKPAMAPKQSILKKPPLAQKPAYPLKQDCEVLSLIHSPSAVLTKHPWWLLCLIYPLMGKLRHSEGSNRLGTTQRVSGRTGIRTWELQFPGLSPVQPHVCCMHSVFSA